MGARQYAAPTAVIIPEDQDSNQAVAHHSVIYLTKEGEVRHISEIHPFYDPLHYVLLFPRIELGWHPNVMLP